MNPQKITRWTAPALALALMLAGCDRDDALPPPPAPPTPQAATAAPTAAEPAAEPGSVATAAAADEPAPEAPQPVEIGQIRNVHLVAGCLTAGAPTPEDFKLLADRGVKAVVNLREESEGDHEAEKAAVAAAGLEYVHIPFSGPETLTDAVFDRFRAAMKDLGGKDVFVHCASANRVGAVWMAYRTLDAGLSAEAALAEAKAVGLRSDALQEKAADYIERHR